MDEIGTLVVVRPWAASAVTEAAGEYTHEFTRWQEEARATAADVGSAVFPMDTQAVPVVARAFALAQRHLGAR